MILISIDLTQIKESGKVTKSEKNGRSYINLVIDTKRETDQYGNTHHAYISQSKDERDAKAVKTYVGNGKEFIFNQQQSAPPPQQSVQNTTFEDEGDDLPF